MRSYGITNAAPYATAPAVGATGDTYYNTVSKLLYLSDGTAWNAVSSGGGGGTASYFYGQTGGGSLTGSIYTPIYLNLLSASGFTVSNQYVTCAVAGRYLVSASLGISMGSGGGAQYTLLRLEHFSSGGTSKSSRDVLGGWGAASMYTQSEAEAIFDMVVGDYVVLSMQPAVTCTLDNRSYVSVVPVGGAKGDKGDNPTGPSSYWYGVSATPPSTAQGSDVPFNLGWTTTSTNGFTLASSGQRITPTVAGKYKITVELSFYYGSGASYTRATIQHYNSVGNQKASNSTVGNGGASGTYGEAVIDGVFDAVVGDYFVITGSIAGGTGYALVGSSYCTVTPVGDGVIGPVGPAGGSFGIVAKGSFLAASVAVPGGGVVTGLTNTISKLLVSGRRYRVKFACRAAGPPAANSLLRLYLRVNGTSISGSQVLETLVSGIYDFFTYEWLLDGDGLTKTIDVAASGDSPTTFYFEPELSFFYVEDVGLVDPVSTPTQVMSTDVWNVGWGDVTTPAVATSNSPTATSGAFVDHPSLTATFTPVVGRRYELSLFGNVVGDVAPTTVDLAIRDSANNVLARGRITPASATNVEVTRLDGILTPSTVAAITVKGSVARVAGTGNAYIYADGTLPATLRVKDVGPVTVAPAATWPPKGPTIAPGNAIGIVAMGAANSLTLVTANALYDMSSIIGFTPQVGRRYRINYSSRAITGPSSVTFMCFTGSAKDATLNLDDFYFATERAYGSVSATWMLNNGDGVARTWKIVGQTATANTSCYNGTFTVEDVGPSFTPALSMYDTPQPWIPFNPTFTCGGIGGQSVTFDCRYTRIGRLITAHYAIRLISCGAGQYDVTLPVPARVIGAPFARIWGDVIGTASIVTGGPAQWQGIAKLDNTNQMYFASTSQAPTANTWSITYPAVANTGDEIFATVNYEAAS